MPVIRRHDRAPLLRQFWVGQIRRPVDVPVQIVQVMSELVDNHVMAFRRVSPLSNDLLPCQDGRPSVDRLSRKHPPGFVFPRPLAGNGEHRGIDQDGQHAREELVVRPQEEKARLGSNGNLHLLGDLEPTTSLPVFFGDENAHVVP